MTAVEPLDLRRAAGEGLEGGRGTRPPGHQT